MTVERLADLDELVLKCRNEWAKKVIAEAVACYRAGAYRASIVSTWVAVVFDFIQKLKELDIAGDANARTKVEEFERIRSKHDVKASLDFERNILNLVSKEFELISPLELEDLKRLMDDRHRCAHPTMISSDDVYNPTAELTRYHLRNAITYVLQQPSVQGKAALEALMNDVLSAYFPKNSEDARKFLSAGPFLRPKQSLVTNFCKVLIKHILIETDEEEEIQNCYAALEAVQGLQPEPSEKVFEVVLSEIFRRVPDENLDKAIVFLNKFPHTGDFLASDVKLRFENFIKSLNERNILNLSLALSVDSLRGSALEKVKELTLSELNILMKEKVRAQYIDRAFELYEECGTFDNANTVGRKIIIPLAKTHFGTEYVRRLFQIASVNDQVSGSFAFEDVIEAIKNNSLLDDEELFTLLQEYDLEGFIPEEEDDEVGKE